MVKDIRRKTRRHFSAEDKIRAVLAGPLGDDSIAEVLLQERHCLEPGIRKCCIKCFRQTLPRASKMTCPSTCHQNVSHLPSEDAPFELYEHIDALTHIMSHDNATQLRSGLQYQKGELFDRALGGVGMDGGH